MSRIGRIPVAIPKGVDVKLSDNNTLTVKGQKELDETVPQRYDYQG